MVEATEAKVFTKPWWLLSAAHPPEGKRMGHAGAIASDGHGTAAGKVRTLEKAGALTAARPSQIGALLRQALG